MDRYCELIKTLGGNLQHIGYERRDEREKHDKLGKSQQLTRTTKMLSIRRKLKTPKKTLVTYSS